MTKEEIKTQCNLSDVSRRDDIDNAMDIYAKQQSVEFYKWINRDSHIVNGEYVATKFEDLYDYFSKV